MRLVDYVHLINDSLSGKMAAGDVAGPEPHSQETLDAIKELESVPLFMRELPKDDAGDNDALEALRTLLYDGSPTGMGRLLLA